MATQTKPAAQPQLSPEQLNGLQRRAILKSGVKMKQSIFSTTIANPGANNNVINVVPRNVGLLLRFIVEVTATYAVTTGASAATTDFGALNSLSNVQFTDLQNNQRHNTYGLHFGMVSAFKEQQPWLGATSMAQESGNYGGNWPIATAVAPTTSVTGSSRTVYEIPVAIHDDDLRGAIYAGVVANQMNLQLTVNPNPTVLPAADDTFAVFSGAGVTGGGACTSVTINVYQEYYDQLPIGPQGIVLPQLDVATVYQLLYTSFKNIPAGQDFYFPYTNYRKYLSQIAIYNNSGVAGGRVTGADITYWAQVAANFTNIFNNGPLEQARIARRILGTDPPPGLYYFPSRSKPIDTLNYGNMQLDLKPITAGNNAYCLMMSEFIAYQNALANAGSLPANG
jgi:P3 major capsid protein